MKILAIDTVTEACSVALNLNGEITQHLEIAPTGHSQLVLGMVRSLLDQCGLDLGELDALAVDVGPGSFTGLRIGIGVAQGLAYGAGLPVIPVGSLQALALAVSREWVLPAIDARMDQVYYGFYRLSSSGELKTLVEPTLASPTRVAVRHRGEIIGTGSGWDGYAAVISGAVDASVSQWLPKQYPEAAAISKLACRSGSGNALSPLNLNASYVRDEVVTQTR